MHAISLTKTLIWIIDPTAGGQMYVCSLSQWCGTIDLIQSTEMFYFLHNHLWAKPADWCRLINALGNEYPDYNLSVAIMLMFVTGCLIKYPFRQIANVLAIINQFFYPIAIIWKLRCAFGHAHFHGPYSNGSCCIHFLGNLNLVRFKFSLRLVNSKRTKKE